MNSKLTLSINHDVKEKAKAYAKANNTSVSKLVEMFLSNISEVNISDDSWKENLTPVVRDMVGSLDKSKLIEDERYQYIINKYS